MELLLGWVLHYIARNNGEENNGGNTTMVTDTIMANNGMGHGGVQSAFPSFCYGVISESYKVKLI